jgi:hypothetical protein
MTPNATVPGPVHLKRAWNLKRNPFPQAGVARLGGRDPRENGLLFRRDVLPEQFRETVEKFVLGPAYGGTKFGYLWSLGSGLDGTGDYGALGYGKSVLLQDLVEEINNDFGRNLLLEAGLDDEDAEEHRLCAVLASFDMANARSLAAVFFEATRYACKFRHSDTAPTLAERLRTELVSRLRSDDPHDLREAVLEQIDNVRGRTLGPPVEEFVSQLCAGDPAQTGRYIEAVKSGARGRVQAANYLATLLYFARAAGIEHVLLGCDQLEDFAATSTTRQRRQVETERFRDFVLELQPMADMLSVVVTLHPRAEHAIGEMWRLADLPDFDPTRTRNARHVVVLRELQTIEQVKKLFEPYLCAARRDPSIVSDPLEPFTEEAIGEILALTSGKPRDLLRAAYALVEEGAADNWQCIGAAHVGSTLTSLDLTHDGEDVDFMPSTTESNEVTFE